MINKKDLSGEEGLFVILGIICEMRVKMLFFHSLLGKNATCL